VNKREILQYFDKYFGDRYIAYPSSIKTDQDNYFFMVKDGKEKFLIVVALPNLAKKFEGENLEEKIVNEHRLFIKKSYLNHQNLNLLREIFPHLNPSVCGLRASFGTGDRLGIATPAHIHAFEDKKLFPILAQQSVREMTRTERNWQKVLNDATWGCFEAGYEGPFGADADHIKEIKDLKEAVDCGYTMFTLDPSDFIGKDLSKLTRKELNNFYNQIPEKNKIKNLYLDKTYIINGYKLTFNDEYLTDIMIIYLGALNYIEKCYKILKDYKKDNFDLEISVDETPAVTSPLAHLFLVLELQSRRIDFQNLALHFLGNWQKGIDYIGDVNKFTQEFSLHIAIAKKMGRYKLSLHSGSDKFSVYPIFARETGGLYHIKTAELPII